MAYEQLKLDNQLCFRVYTAARLITSAYTPYFKRYGLTYPQYLVMMILWEKDHIVIGEITEKLQLETNTVTPLLQRMEKMGLIERQKSSTDCRQRIISLTEKGRNLETELKEIPNCLASDILKHGISPEELQTLIPLLDKLIESLTSIPATPPPSFK